jgi:hypothetical protein
LFFWACDAVGDEMCSESKRFDRKNIIYKLIEVKEVTNENYKRSSRKNSKNMVTVQA